MAAAFPPVLINIERQLTDSEPVRSLYALADRTLQTPGVLSNTVLLGFPYADVKEIGTSTIQSRALGGLSNGTLVFCMPGSKNACRTAWTRILHNQLDVTFNPCNFVELIPRFDER